MSLVPATCGAAIWSGYSPIVSGSTVDFGAVFASAYNTYATAGLVPGAVNTGGTASFLESFINAVQSRTLTVDEMASALASFWATVAILPGAPAHGGLSVVSVINDAAVQTAAFRSAIVASITDVDTTPYFETMVTNIQSIGLAAVTWTVTELMPGAPPFPVAYPEAIS